MKREAGASMIETMIALAIGAVLTGVVLVTVTGSGLSGRKLDAQAALNENGQVALGLLAGQIRMAGYWLPDSEVQTLDATPDGLPMVLGCTAGFAVPDAAWGELACSTAPAGAAEGAIAIRFQAGEPGTAMAMDCAGRDITTVGRTQIEDRYFVRTTGTESGNPALYCQPTTGGAPVALVDDVEAMTLRFGISPVAPAATTNRAFDAPVLEGRTATYLPAQSFVATCTPGAVPVNSWCAVTVVDVCLRMRSGDNAADQAATPFVDCDGQLRTLPDRRLRRAITTTISLRNRTTVPLQAAR